ncbi:37011_t:CDS:10, partial [Racocetra persica]
DKLLRWEQAKPYADHIRNQGINQFLSMYNKAKDRKNDSLLWGDEIEYMVIAYDDGNKNVKLSLRAQDILQELQKEVEETLRKGEVVDALWHPEYGAYMIEGIPGIPYGSSLRSLTLVEQNMKLRREIASKYLNPNESLVTLVGFPRLGCSGQFLDPHHEPFGPESRSLFVPDEAINSHAKFRAVNVGLESRRGSKVALNVPIFHDKKSQNLFINCEEALPDHIYMDASVYGGYLSDIDCRWTVLAESADDRTKEERVKPVPKFNPTLTVTYACLSSKPLKNDRFLINKSRYDSIAYYISTDKALKTEYNDLNSAYDPNIYKKLTDNGVDDLLARHISYLFIRDPLFVFEGSLNQDNESSTEHFEVNLNSTNWQSVRFKPPPPNSNIGWRVEFRCMEIQTTDFENAAFVDENIMVACKRDALNAEKFWFRKSAFANSDGIGVDFTNYSNYLNLPVYKDEFEKMTINEIINGNKDNKFPGLIKMMLQYLESVNIDVETRYQLEKYLEFVGMRASKIQTTATWIRNFVRSHPNYNHDSIVSQEINYDLIKTIEKIQKGQIKMPELLGA